MAAAKTFSKISIKIQNSRVEKNVVKLNEIHNSEAIYNIRIKLKKTLYVVLNEEEIIQRK